MAVLWDEASTDQRRAAEAAARSVGAELPAVELRQPPDEFASAFAAAVQGQAEALWVLTSPIFAIQQEHILDLATKRHRPDDPYEPIFRAAYRTVSREFVRAVRAAQGTLRAAGQNEEAGRLDGVTWHALRHTFASRLVAAGVDLRTVQELGWWRTLSMVQRYAHLSPGHLIAAVEKIAPAPAVAVARNGSAVELRQDLDSAVIEASAQGVRYSLNS